MEIDDVKLRHPSFNNARLSNIYVIVDTNSTSLFTLNGLLIMDLV